MRITNNISHNTQSNINKNNSLHKGDIIRGKVVSVDGNTATIDLGNGNQIKGKTQVSLEKFKGKVLNLMVKEANGSKIVLTPMMGSAEGKKEQEIFIKNILDKLGLIKSGKNTEIIKTLTKYKMPINQQSIDKISVVLDKLEGLLNLGENEKLELISSKNNPLSEEIDKIIKSTDNQNNKGNKLTELIKSNLEHITSDREIDSSLVKKVAVLLKNDMKISINNLKYLSDIIDNKNLLESDFEKLLQQMDKEGYKTEEIKNQLDKLKQIKILNFDSSDKELLKNSTKELTKLIDDIQNSFQLKGDTSQEISDRINSLNNKIDFLNKLNENSTFFYIPFKLPKKDLEKNLFILNKNKRNKKKDRLKIFISLDTSNLKKVDVIMEVYKDNLSINFGVENKEILNFIKLKKDELTNTLESGEYNNTNISIKLNKEKKNDPLDLLAEDKGLNYLLDVRV